MRKCARTVCDNPGNYKHKGNGNFYCLQCARDIWSFCKNDGVELFDLDLLYPQNKKDKDEKTQKETSF